VRHHVNVPNALTAFRILLVPVLVVVILTRPEQHEGISVGIFLLAAATDWLDGWLARRNSQVTTLGALLDPLADKLLIAGALISLVEVGRAPAWMVVIIIGREFAVTGLRAIAAEQGIAIAAREWGKVKMVVQVVCIVALLMSQEQDAELAPGLLGQLDLLMKPLGDALLWGTVLVSAISAIDYFRLFSGLFEKQGAKDGAEDEE
jgi:CDP-diacylglycerol--glycerol-3-phosphate 3-phosphatidyltransferase